MNIKFNTILLTLLAGWINRHQQDVIEYLKAENKILKDSHGSKRILLSDAQRIRLATMGKKVGLKALSEICNAFSPETILKWHRNLVARKYGHERLGGLLKTYRRAA